MTAEQRVAAWRASREALAVEAERVVALLRETPHPPPRPPKETWGFAEIATHLSHGWMVLPQLAQGDEKPIVELVGQSAITLPSEMGALTEGAVARDPERDPLALADRIETAASAYLSWCSDDDVDVATQWMAVGVQAPMPMFTAHLLNETVLHGVDLARAAGRRWRVEPAHAALALHGFLVPVIEQLSDRLVDPHAPDRRIVVHFHVRDADAIRLRLEDGTFHIDDVSAPGRVDAHVRADAATLLQFLWGRQSLASAAVRGPMLLWGRAPWRALVMARAVALP